MSDAGEPLLAVRELSVSVTGASGRVSIVDRVSLDVHHGEAVAIVGESGCGKSLTALAIMQLLPLGARVDGGSIRWQGRELCGLPDRELCALRGGALALVFQEPSAALNPVYTVGAQIAEAIRLHHAVSRGAARERAIAWLGKVGLPEPAALYEAYPHELSGGMKQRALIAMALCNEPTLLIADEPTSALDRTLQAQVLELLDQERERRALALLVISHDLATVAEETDRVIVMYAGRIVESGPTFELLTAPLHPYTHALLSCSPEHDAARRREGKGSERRHLPVIEGGPPSFADPPPGCRFAPRCTSAKGACRDPGPALTEVEPGRHVACVLYAGPTARDEATSRPAGDEP